ncbi:MAG: sigma-70 family RNA polymerase sigma factor [Sandaracinaceae bacterium]
MGAPRRLPDSPSWRTAIAALPELAAEEERALIRCAQAGDEEARRRVVESQLPMVLRCARAHSRYRVPLAELVSEGTLGVLEALDRFEVERGLRFATYASTWIRNFVLRRSIREHAPDGSLRGAYRTKYWFRLRRELARAHALGFGPAERVELVAERLGLSRRNVEELLQHLASRPVPLSAPAKHDADLPPRDTLSSPDPDPEEAVASAQRRRLVAAQVAGALDRLEARDREIIERRLMAEEPDTLEVLALEKGLTRQRIHQIEVRARKKLARWLRHLPRGHAA